MFYKKGVNNTKRVRKYTKIFSISCRLNQYKKWKKLAFEHGLSMSQFMRIAATAQARNTMVLTELTKILNKRSQFDGLKK